MGQTAMILTILAGYFILWLGLSYYASKGADNSTFFSAGRKMPWPLVAIAMLGAPITGVTFISVPGMVMGKGFSYLQMCMGFIVGYLIIAFVLIPIYYRLNIVSIYGYLERRFGSGGSKTGAWLFTVSKLLGISVRFLVVCAMLQLLLFDPLGIPYVFSVVASLLLVWLTTYRGGVRSVIWSDVLKSVCLLSAVGLSLYFITSGLGMPVGEIAERVSDHPSARVFHFDDPMDAKYFWKQFVAGIFIVIAMTGLDQDMMQRTLACRSARDSRKNLIAGTLLQTFIITLLLMLGAVMMLYAESRGVALPEKSDNLFATIAFRDEIPMIVGALFVLGLISATFASVGSALTAMTTTVTLDLLDGDAAGEAAVGRKRKRIHALLSLLMAVLVLLFYYLNRDDAISMVYTLISYTDGPILGLFLFGLLTRREVSMRWLPVVCIAAPVASWLLQWAAEAYFGYTISFELLIINAAFTFAGLRLASKLTVTSSKVVSGMRVS